MFNMHPDISPLLHNNHNCLDEDRYCHEKYGYCYCHITQDNWITQSNCYSVADVAATVDLYIL